MPRVGNLLEARNGGERQRQDFKEKPPKMGTGERRVKASLAKLQSVRSGYGPSKVPQAGDLSGAVLLDDF